MATVTAGGASKANAVGKEGMILRRRCLRGLIKNGNATILANCVDLVVL